MSLWAGSKGLDNGQWINTIWRLDEGGAGRSLAFLGSIGGDGDPPPGTCPRCRRRDRCVPVGPMPPPGERGAGAGRAIGAQLLALRRDGCTGRGPSWTSPSPTPAAVRFEGVYGSGSGRQKEWFQTTCEGMWKKRELGNRPQWGEVAGGSRGGKE